MICTSVRWSVAVSEEGWLIVVVWTTAPLLYQVMVCPLRSLLLEHRMLTELPAVTTPPPAADRTATGYRDNTLNTPREGRKYCSFRWALTTHKRLHIHLSAIGSSAGVLSRVSYCEIDNSLCIANLRKAST